MEAHRILERQLSEIHRKADVIADRSNAAAWWPPLLVRETANSQFESYLRGPAVLWRTPDRGGSKRARVHRSRAVAMHASFRFEATRLIGHRASMAVYDVEHDRDADRLRLCDAYHFDAETQPCKAYHPVFHVQRGAIADWEPEELRRNLLQLSVLRHRDVVIEEAQSEFPTRDFRVPTPQMDYTAVLVSILASYFCHEKAGNDIKRSFQSILELTMHQRNPARISQQAERLVERWASESAAPFCAAHWYDESCG